MSEKPLLRPLDCATDAHLVGAKAHNLGRLLRAGFPVPQGWTIGTDVSADSTDGRLPVALGDALAALPECRYAVRSSGQLEDLGHLSFAGQYTTLLDVPRDGLADAVRACLVSAGSDTAAAYLERHGLEQAGMAVIVQRLVPAEFSGVAFTVDPLTGADTELVIEYVPGLGEALVSGRAEPRSARRDWRDDRWLDGPEHPWLNELASLCADAQQLFGHPLDIEWAYADGQVWLLQARPVTTITHTGLRDVWTTADFKDGGVSAGVCTPYMWSLYEYIWEHALKDFLLTSHLIREHDLRQLGHMFYGRPYWNLSVVKEVMARTPGYVEREFDEEFGIQPTYEGDGATTGLSPLVLLRLAPAALAQSRLLAKREAEAPQLAEQLRARVAQRLDDLAALTQAVSDMPAAHVPSGDEPSVPAPDAEAPAPPTPQAGAPLPSTDVPAPAPSAHNAEAPLPSDDSFRALSRAFIELTSTDYLASESTYFWQIFLNTIHQSLFKDAVNRHTDATGYLQLIGGLEDVSHLRPFADLWRISRKLREQGGDPAAELAAHVECFGYHSDKELDVSYPNYWEQPEVVAAQLAEITTLDDSHDPAVTAARQQAAYAERLASLRATMPRRAYDKLARQVERMRRLLWWREEFRDISTAMYDVIRRYTVALAGRLAAHGTLTDGDDIWFLAVGDVWDLLEGRMSPADARALVAKNRRYYRAYRHYTSENEIGPSLRAAGSSNGLHGIGCSVGRVTGRARVVAGLDEIGRIADGDILVTRFTDTGWTAKFALLRGVVTEYGGLLCHSAIVSREYGIPCVVGVKNALTSIHDGDTLTVDGGSGSIEVIA